MEMRVLRWTSGVVIGLFAASCGSVQDVKAQSGANHDLHVATVVDDDDDDGEDENEVEVALAQVPDAVKSAALAAVPGLVLTGAEKETEDGSVRYCLEGTASGEVVEVEVDAASARVVEIERGEDDDE